MLMEKLFVQNRYLFGWWDWETREVGRPAGHGLVDAPVIDDENEFVESDGDTL
jgi:hypothetical protein